MLVPDLIAEIVSPTDHLSDAEQKIARYLADGVRVVWLIKLEGQTVTIFTPGSQQLTRRRAADTLTGGDVKPGFEVPVSRLFTTGS